MWGIARVVRKIDQVTRKLDRHSEETEDVRMKIFVGTRIEDENWFIRAGLRRLVRRGVLE